MPTICQGQVKSKNNDGDILTNLNQKSSSPSPTKPSPASFLTDQSEVCKKCRKSFDGKHKHGIQCDRCMTWWHQACTTLTKAEQKTLQSSAAHNNLKWFCEVCDGEYGKIDPVLGTLLARHATQMEALTNLVTQLTEQIKQNSKTIELLRNEKKTDEQMKVHVEEVLNDQLERDQKKNNIIMYNLPEGTDQDEEKNKTDDLDKAKEVLKFVNSEVKTENYDKSKIMRIGPKRSNKVRPVKIIMENQDCKNNILRNARNLKESEKFSKIGLSFDKTRKQQEEYRKLKEKLEEHKKKDDGKDYVIFRNQIVVRSEIANIIRKSKESAGTGWSSSAPVGGNPKAAADSKVVGDE